MLSSAVSSVKSPPASSTDEPAFRPFALSDVSDEESDEDVVWSPPKPQFAFASPVPVVLAFAEPPPVVMLYVPPSVFRTVSA